MPDGRLLTAGYPIDNGNGRERSGSNSSYNSYHGDNHARYMSNAGHDGRGYPRRTSISQHRPSRSQSGQNQFQYPNGNHTSDFQHIRSYPAAYASGPHQQPPGAALGAVISEVLQHEREITHFQQQQMPLAVTNNRTNTATTAHPRSYGGAQPESHRVNTTFEHGPAIPNMPGLSENKKENSPMKRK